MVRHRLVSGLPEPLAPLPRSPAPPCTPCVEDQQRAAPHSSSFPPTTAPFQTLHLDVWGPSPVLGPRQERYFLIVVDDYSRYTTILPLRPKADVPTVLEPWLLARGDAQALCGPRLHSERGAEQRIGLVMEVAQTSMCHAGAPQFLWPQAFRYAAHQLNLWPSDTRPRVTTVSLWTGSPSVAADYCVWGSLAHVRALGVNKLPARTRAYVFLGFPLDTSGWQFFDPVTNQFFISHDVTFNESVSYYRSRPHSGSETFSPLMFFTTEPPPVAPVAPPSSRPAPSGVLHITPQSSPMQRPIPLVSGGAGGAVAKVTPMEDTAASSRRPCPTSPPGFTSVPQFPPCSSLRPVAAEPGGVPAGGNGGPKGVGGGGASSGGAGQRLLRLEREECKRFERARQQQQQQEEEEQPQSQQQQDRVEEESQQQQEREEEGSQLQQQVDLQPRARFPPAAASVVTNTARESSAGVPVAAADAAAAAAGESGGGATGAAAGAGTVMAEARGGGAAGTATTRPARPSTCALGSWCQRSTSDPRLILGKCYWLVVLGGYGRTDPLLNKPFYPSGLVTGILTRGPLLSPPVPPVQSLSSSQWTRHSPLSCVVSPEPRRSRYRGDGLFHLVLRSRVPPPPVLPQPPESSLTVLHDPLSNYLRASHRVVSRVLSALVTHPTAPLSSVLALVTTGVGFSWSHHFDYASHLMSGTAHRSTGGVHVFTLEFLEDRHFELGFLAAAVPHLCAMLLAPEGGP
ncbi:unnamed protein product, partial [Closterium sp. NIES-53]